MIVKTVLIQSVLRKHKQFSLPQIKRLRSLQSHTEYQDNQKMANKVNMIRKVLCNITVEPFYFFKSENDLPIQTKDSCDTVEYKIHVTLK